MLKIFIPAYNEENVIEKTIIDISSLLSKISNDYKLYLIDDGSTDNTGIIGSSMKLKNFFYIKCNGPSRRENLVQSMIKHSNDGDIVCFMDADRSTGEDAIKNAVNSIKKGYDIVIGSRYVKGSKIKRKSDRLFISKIFNAFVRFFYGSKINDHECGFKFFKADVLKVLVKDMGINYQRKMFWDSEMLIRAQRKNFSILEVPVFWVEGPKSSLSFSKELPMIWY